MSTNNKNNRSTSDEQAVRKNLSRALDHELANEPLTAAERLNNKKTKKRQ
ncbi:small acid-soluble spore protein O [Solibacillus sp. FSL R5-0691]